MGMDEEDYLRLVGGMRSLTPPYFRDQQQHHHHHVAGDPDPVAKLQHLPHPHGSQGGRCLHCEEMERIVIALQSGVEFLRAAALRNEAIIAGGGGIGGMGAGVCSECWASGAGSAGSVASVNTTGRQSTASGGPKKKKGATPILSLSTSATSLYTQVGEASVRGGEVGGAGPGEASQRLVEVSVRHKRQVEQMSKDMVRLMGCYNVL